jgi:oligoribonuclease (3'-5' exoribonuclease)
MNQKYQDVDESTLKTLLKDRMKEFKAAEKARKPHLELNNIYQDIKEIKHQLTFRQVDKLM